MAASEIAFELRHNMIIVVVAVNGLALPMIVDTGAGRTIISEPAAANMGLSQQADACTATGAGGDISLSSVHLDSMRVGSASRTAFECLTMDMADLHAKIGDDIEGILGFDFLSQFRVTIDYPARLLRFSG